MHPYYEQNKEKFKKEMEGYLSLILEELEKETGRAFSSILQETWECYEKDMLEKFPYIGGSKSSGTRNLTGAFMYVALGEVCTRQGMPLEKWGYLTTLSYQRFYEKIPGFLKKLMGRVINSPGLIIRLLKKKDRANEKNARENPGSFETKTMPPTAEYPAVYYTTVCPLAGFAEKNGYMKYMPYICNLDYAMFAAINVPFYREKTCASGDEYCDFKLKPGAPVVPAWPCHGADKNDPLK